MTTWIIPCNEKYYDHKSAFANLETIDWRQSTNVEKGDTVYIYVGKPRSCILYKCTVIEANIRVPDTSDSVYEKGDVLSSASRYMRIKLVEEYKEGTLPYRSLIANGLRSVQGPSKASVELEQYIEMVSTN